MGSRMKGLALSGTLAVGLILGFGATGNARQNIQPSAQAIEAAGPVDVNGGMVILVSHNEADVTWQPSPDPRVEGYNVWKGTDPKNMTPKKVGKGVTSITFNKLDMGMTWYFAVSTVGKVGKTKSESELSNLTSKYIDLPAGKKH